MRYDAGQKARTRARILREAARRFREDGIAATGLKGLMGAAGLTVGGFYKHFGSKADLVRGALELSLERTVAFLGRVDPTDEAQKRRALRAYLGRWHVEHPAEGCPLPSLAAEVARADAPTRAFYDGAMQRLVDAVTPSLAGGDRARAWAIVATCVGGVLLARASQDPAQRDEILAACRDALAE